MEGVHTTTGSGEKAGLSLNLEPAFKSKNSIFPPPHASDNDS